MEKNKQTKWNSGVERNKDVLKLIHAYICVLFLMDSWNEQIYFIMFIDDSSLFKLWEVLASRHLVFHRWSWTSTKKRKKIKIVKSDRGEYYDRFDIRYNILNPHVFFFNNCEIVLQYIMLGKSLLSELLTKFVLDPFIRIGLIPSLSDRVLNQNVGLNAKTLRIWKVYIYKKRKTSEKRTRRMISSLSWKVGWGVGWI